MKFIHSVKTTNEEATATYAVDSKRTSRSLRSIAATLLATLALVAVIVCADFSKASKLRANNKNALARSHVQRMMTGGGSSPAVVENLVNSESPSDFSDSTTPSSDFTVPSSGTDYVGDQSTTWGDHSSSEFAGTSSGGSDDPMTSFLQHMSQLISWIMKGYK